MSTQRVQVLYISETYELGDSDKQYCLDITGLKYYTVSVDREVLSTPSFSILT